MGDTVKAIAGLALAYFAPVLAGLTTNIWAYGAVLAGATLVGASIAGSALAPDVGDTGGADSYAGQKLQTTKNNTSAVPIIYGSNRVGGNIIWQSTNDAVNNDDSANGYNRDYWGVIVIVGHFINNITAVYANDKLLTESTSNSDRTASEYTHVKWNNASSSSATIGDTNFVKNDSYDIATYNTLVGSITESDLTLSSNNTSANRGNLIDNDSNSRWGSSSGDWVSIDLGVNGSVSSIGFKPIGYTGYMTWNVVYNVKIQYSDDNSTWTDTGDNASGSLREDFGIYPTITISNSHSSEHQYWRLYLTTLYDPYYSSKSIGELIINSSVAVNVTIPKDTTYLSVHQVYDSQQNKNTQFDNITVELEGKKIRTMTDANTISTALSYSNNPANIVLDLLGDALSISDSDIDTASFYQAQQDCSSNGWTCNLAIIQQANIQSIISDVLATCRGQIVHSGNKWKLKIDTKSQTIVKTLDDDDFINNSLSIAMRGNGDIANKIILKYINPSDSWLSAQASKEDTTLQNWDGQTIEKVLDVKGVTNTTQANELAEITLNSMRYSEDASGNRIKQTPLVLSFATTVKNADLEVGDVIIVDSDLLDRNRKFMILSIETDQSGLIQLSTREYCETHYKDSSGTYLI